MMDLLILEVIKLLNLLENLRLTGSSINRGSYNFEICLTTFSKDQGADYWLGKIGSTKKKAGYFHLMMELK